LGVGAIVDIKSEVNDPVLVELFVFIIEQRVAQCINDLRKLFGIALSRPERPVGIGFIKCIDSDPASCFDIGSDTVFDIRQIFGREYLEQKKDKKNRFK